MHLHPEAAWVLLLFILFWVALSFVQCEEETILNDDVDYFADCEPPYFGETDNSVKAVSSFKNAVVGVAQNHAPFREALHESFPLEMGDYGYRCHGY